MEIIYHEGEGKWPTVKLTLSEYNELPDYSITSPRDISIGDVWKLPELASPHELLLCRKMENQMDQLMIGEIIDENLAIMSEMTFKDAFYQFTDQELNSLHMYFNDENKFLGLGLIGMGRKFTKFADPLKFQALQVLEDHTRWLIESKNMKFNLVPMTGQENLEEPFVVSGNPVKEAISNV